MLQELTKWVNQQLGAGGYTEQLVTDLGLDMADGITLLHLVQALGELYVTLLHEEGVSH